MPHVSHKWSFRDIRSEAKVSGKPLSGGCPQFKFQVISEDTVEVTQLRAERKEGNEDGIIKTEAREDSTPRSAVRTLTPCLEHSRDY